MELPIYLEIHVDDLLLSKQVSAWPDAAMLLDTLAKRAEAAGAQLSFRVRGDFARMDGSNFLLELQQRGHEVGLHAHGEGLADVAAALAGARVHHGTRVSAPGLVQRGARGRMDLLQQARKLGSQRITDRLEERFFAYQGWLAWEPIPGLWSLDVSVSPFDWGVLIRRSDKVAHAWGTMDWTALAARLEQRARLRPPEGSSPFFGATVHEHNFCPPDRLTPLRQALDGFSRFVDRYGPRIQRSGDIPIHPLPPTLHPPRPLLARARAAAVRLERKVQARLHHGSVQVEGRTITYQRTGPERPRAHLLVVHGGISGVEQGLSFVGLRPQELAEAGIAVWCFARTEGVARTPGNPVHIADTAAMYQKVRDEGAPVGVLTWSAGLIPFLRVVEKTQQQPLFLIDTEAPADRFSIVPPLQPKHELLKKDLFDDDAWAGLEAVALLRHLKAPYVRLQAELDHVHGLMHWHARRMVEAAHGRLNVSGEILSGKISDHADKIKSLILNEFHRAPSSPPR